MSQLFGIGLTIECNRLVAHQRMLLQKKPQIGLRSLAMILEKCDSNVISCEQFEQALNSYG